MSNILYVGPSWAHRSYDTNEGSELDYTNLARELDLDIVDLSRVGAGNMEMLEKVKGYTGDYLGIIWVYAEPVIDFTKQEQDQFITSEDCDKLREIKHQQILQAIADLNCPIALIGAHSDVGYCNHANISIIHPSWQRFLAMSTGTNIEYAWGADVAHRIFLEEYRNIKPSKKLVNMIISTFKSWREMESKNVFKWVHPNQNGNSLFAKAIEKDLTSWINRVKIS